VHWAVWDPVLFNLDKLLCCCHHLMYVEVGNAQLCMGRVHPATVLVEAVHLYAVVNSPIGLRPLEALDTIVESGILGHQVKWCIGNNLRFLPATVMVVVVNFKHVVCGYAAESVLVFWAWFRLQIFGFFKN
jgi:hypothetical protein